MSGIRYRTASIAAAGTLAIAMLVSGARATEPTEGEPKATATMQCDRVTEPGRVRCSVEARTTGGRSIAWADVALIDLPEFTAALKGRIGPADAVAKEAGLQRWAFGLVAKKTGEGEAKARVRLVVCDAAADAGPRQCAPATIDVHTVVHVG
jgi:hypothetical protein